MKLGAHDPHNGKKRETKIKQTDREIEEEYTKFFFCVCTYEMNRNENRFSLCNEIEMCADAEMMETTIFTLTSYNLINSIIPESDPMCTNSSINFIKTTIFPSRWDGFICIRIYSLFFLLFFYPVVAFLPFSEMKS